MSDLPTRSTNKRFNQTVLDTWCCGGCVSQDSIKKSFQETESYWHYWGLEAEGIPIEQGIVSREGLPPLPIVRDPTQEEIDGLNAGTRPDLSEKIRNYKAIVKLYNDDITAEAVKSFKKKQERRAVRITKLRDRLRLKLPKEAMSKLRSRLELELKWERRSREREAKILARWCGPLEGRRSG